jgi:glycerol dehydrogenase
MRIFAATSRYIQGPGVLDSLGKHCAELGQRAVVIADVDVMRLFGPRLRRSFSDVEAAATMLEFPGEVTHRSIDALCARAREVAADVVVGVGGGKGIDTGKAVARALGSRFVSVPTIASNDGPASAAIAVYDEDHRMLEILHLKRNPDLVLVDSQAIIAAPLRFLRAGIGDALSKKFEAEACDKAGALTLLSAPPSPTGMMIADGCYRLLRENGVAGLRDAQAGRVTESVERVIEAAVLLSTLSFENGGLSVAHALARGIPYVARAAGTLHGEHVAYGLLVQFLLESRSDEFFTDIVDFYEAIGLPMRLAQLGVKDPSHAEIEQIAEGSMMSPSVRRFPEQLTAGRLIEAIRLVEDRATRPTPSGRLRAAQMPTLS